MESNADGKHFVTARGWEDLSCILYSYESLKEPVTELLFGEYLRKEAIARSFSLYYRWYEKEKKDPRLADFLTGKLTDPSLKESLSNAPLEERFTAASLIASFLKNRFESWSEKKEELLKYRELFSDWHRQESGLSDFLKKRLESLVIRRKNALISIPDALWEQKLLEGLEDFALSLPQETQEENVRSFYAEKRAAFQKTEETLAESVRLACSLLEPDNFADPPYLYLITELSKNPLSASFLGSHLVEAYLNASSRLLVSDREAALKKAVRELSPNSL